MDRSVRERYLRLCLVGTITMLTAACSAEDPPTAEAGRPLETRTYHVEGEETLAGIAYEFGIEVADLIEANPGLSGAEALDQDASLNVPRLRDATPVVPTLKPDVPESSTYSGTFGLILDMRDRDGSWLRGFDELDKDFAQPAPQQTADVSLGTVEEWLGATSNGVFAAELFVDPHHLDTLEKIGKAAAVVSSIDDAEVVLEQLKQGKRIQITLGPDEALDGYRFLPDFEPVLYQDPQLFFLEHYRLTNFVSDYGTGRIIKTFSLMPGEKAELTVSSFTRQMLKETEASSILDSYSDETLAEFEQSIRAEQSRQSSSASTTNVRASASASASWGWGKAKASGSYANATSEARASFASNVASATAKNTARASAARNVEINTNVERSVEEEKKESSVRTVENINSSRTLNFIFYQMNQRYVSLLHLTEIELGYDDGRGNLVVVPLYEMRSLLEEVVEDDHVEDAERVVAEALGEIRDYRGRKADEFITEDNWLIIGSPAKPASELDISKAEKVEFIRVNHDYVSSYEVLSEGREFFVDGVIVVAQPLILRTDGVYVESLLGHSSAWSPHTEKIRAEELRELKLKNDRLEKGL